jgi:uncharacterized protein
MSVSHPEANLDSDEAKKTMNNNVVREAMTLVRQGKFDEARALLLAAAEAGEAEAQALLGQVYQAGWGVDVDYAKAFHWWSLAAAGGSTDGQWGLGLLYDEGNGVAEDSAKAVELWQRASSHGNIKATMLLAFSYEAGRGVERDPARSAELFERAAKSGEPGAQLNYGLKLLDGDGVEQAPALGWAWIAVAAASQRASAALAAKAGALSERVWQELSPGERQQAEEAKAKFEWILSRHATGG